MRAPAALVAIPLLAGCAAAIVAFDVSGSDLSLRCALVALLALIAASAAALQDDRPVAAAAVAIAALLAGASLGAGAAASVYRPTLLAWFERAARDEAVLLEGVLREDASPGAFGISLTIDVRSIEAALRREPLAGGVRVTVGGTLVHGRVAGWRAGRTVRMPALLRRPSVYFNPGVPDDRRALARRGIVLVGSVKSGALVENVRDGSFVTEAAAAIRAATRERVHRLMSPRDPKTSAVTTAVLIGDRSALDPADERRLQDAGTYHVIAISGGNIAVLALVLILVLRVMMVPSRIAAVLTAIVLVFYGTVAAGAASVSRAVTVAVVVLAARALDHRGSPLNALAVAGVLAVAWAPVVVLDPGFLLSFGATLAILVGVPRLQPARHPGDGLIGRLAAPIVALGGATVCAEAALAPIGATLFGRVPLAGIILNFAAIPLMTMVQVGGLALAATAGWWDSLAAGSGHLAHLAAAGLLHSARLVDLVPALALDVRPPGPWLVAAYYGCLAFLLGARPRRAPAAVGFAVCVCLMLAGPRATSAGAVAPPRVPLRVIVLDVGQGDATVLQLPGGRTLLVDAAGLAAFSGAPDAFEAQPGFDVGERVVWPALRALGVRRLHGVVLTHGDPDHILGVPGVLRHLRAAAIWEGVPVPGHQGLKAIARLADLRGASWRTLQAGDAERFGEVEVRVLHPPLPAWERQRVRNEDSVVLDIRLGQVSIVLPGDIGREGERAVAARFEPGRLVILKAPHHGSATSSTGVLVDLLRPSAVIFSCGRDNRFGHPHPAVVARYRTAGAALFSTAQDGAVFVETDGTTVAVRGRLGASARFEVKAQ
jgi:competence protein ComEC